MKRESPGDGILIWDIPVRLFHWLIVILLLVLGVSGKFGGLDVSLTIPGGFDVFLTNMDVHMLAGQVLLALVLFRVLWGLVGSSTARFTSFVRGPRAVAAYLREMLRGRLPLSAGHNPAGGMMVILMLALLLLQGFSGLFSSDELFSEGPLAHLVSSANSARLTSWHADIFNVLLGAVILHVLVILYYAARGRNLIGPMFSGRKSIDQIPQQEGGSLEYRSIWLALLLLAIAGALVWSLRLIP